MKLSHILRRKFATGRNYLNFRGAVFFAQQRLQSVAGRRRLARLVARFLPLPVTPAGQQSEAAIHLQTHGFAMIKDIVTPEVASEMFGYLRQQPVVESYALKGPRISIDDPQLPDSHTFAIVEEGLISCPHLLDIANHPTVLAAVEGIFGCKPTIGYMTAWWSAPTADGKPREAEYFHRDMDNIHFLKFFVYLSDVAPENGPHEFIRGSHVMPALCDLRRHADDEVLSIFGAERVVRFIGPAGTSFIENTFGLHRGQPVRSGRRLILQIVYSMLPMAFGPATPYSPALFAGTRIPPDTYVNRVYRAPK